MNNNMNFLKSPLTQWVMKSLFYVHDVDYSN